MSLSEILSLVSSLSAGVGLILVAWQIWESEKSRHLQATWSIFEDLSSEENRALREFAYSGLPENINDFSSDTLTKVEQLGAAFERVALIANKGLVRKDLILAYYVEAIIMCWGKLSPFIKSARKQSYGDLYMIEFEQLANDAKAYWRKYQKNKPWPQMYMVQSSLSQDNQQAKQAQQSDLQNVGQPRGKA